MQSNSVSRQKKCVYQDVKLRPGWYESDSNRYDGIVEFLSEITNGSCEDLDVFNFFETVNQIEGPRGGGASETFPFKGVTLKVTRKRLPTIHSSEDDRWEITVKCL